VRLNRSSSANSAKTPSANQKKVMMDCFMAYAVVRDEFQ
jgi:hypothetical protein